MSGEPPFKRSRGRPRKAPEELATYGKPAPAPRIEGEEYRDRTGRLNPGSFSKGNKAGVGNPNSNIPKALKELCLRHGDACIKTALEIMADPNVAPRDRLNAAKLLLSYGMGLPRAEMGLEVTNKPGWTDLLTQIEERKAAVATTVAVQVSAIEAAIVGEDEDDEE